MQSSPLACPALDCSPCSPARAEGTWARAPTMGTLPRGSPRSGGAAGSPRAGRRDLCVSGPSKCCTSMQGALVFSDTWPWQQQCQTWRALAAAPGLGGSLPRMWGTSHCPFPCEHHARLRVCPCAVGGRGRTVLFRAAGSVKDHPELPRAPTPQQPQLQQQSLPLCSTCPGTCPAPLVPPSRCRSPQHRASALCEHQPCHGLAGECQAGRPGRR